jgi:hypothetical protein
VKTKLYIPIECGIKTCATMEGKMCKYVRVRRLGTVWYCELFPKGDLKTTEIEDRGWLLRHPRCIQQEQEEERDM